MSLQYAQSMIASPAGDAIAQLPVDQNPPSNTEVQIIDTLFKQHRSTMDIIVEESKDALLVAFLVILVSIPQTNSLINRFIPITINSPYILLLVKGLAAAMLYWLVKHFYLSRRT
jgi:hypothetical protein